MADCACNHFPASLGNVTFDAGVQVGIGTASPLAALDLVGTTAPQLIVRGGATSSIRVFPTGGVISSVEVFETSDTSVTNYSRLRLTMDGVNANVIADAGGSGAARALTFSAGGAERARIATSGNLGIGTTSPTKPLEVAGGAAKLNAGLVLGTLSQGGVPGLHSDGTSLYFEANQGNLYFRPQGEGVNTNAMVLTASGYLGIGTLSPTQALDVQGTVHVSGVVLVGQDVTLNGAINKSIGGKLVDQGGCYYAS